MTSPKHSKMMINFKKKLLLQCGISILVNSKYKWVGFFQSLPLNALIYNFNYLIHMSTLDQISKTDELELTQRCWSQL